MSRSRILSSIAAASLGIALFGACSAESLTERAVGFGLEQAIEGDQDIDLDFSDDGTGGFSISTDEGDFAVNFDDDSGGIVFNTDEGDGVISFDEDGIVYNTDEGDGVISFDQDNGTIDFNTDEGDATINFDEDNGTVTFTTEDGEFGIIGGVDVPENWPAFIGAPATWVSGTPSFSSINLGEGGVMTTGVFFHADNDPYATNVIAAFEAHGWTTTIVEDGDVIYASASKDALFSQIIAEPGLTTITIMPV